MRLLLSVIITLLTFASCHHEVPAIVVAKPATQRVTATKSWHLGIYGSLPPRIDTLIIQGKTYLSAAFDSTTFTYDAQDRLTRVNTLQLYSYGSAYPGDPATTTRNAHWTTYTYQGTKLQINEGVEGEAWVWSWPATLDAEQRHIVGRTSYDQASFTFITDTLQQYSVEGLLLSSKQIMIRDGFPRQTTYQRATVEAGNITQKTSSNEAGSVIATTTYEYDLSHAQPLATLTPFGENSRNALLRATTVEGNSRWEYSYVNEYDSLERLVRQTMYYQSSGMLQRQIQTLTNYYY